MSHNKISLNGIEVNEFKIIIINRFKELKEYINKCWNKDNENTQLNEIKRIIQYIKIEFKKYVEFLKSQIEKKT